METEDRPVLDLGSIDFTPDWAKRDAGVSVGHVKSDREGGERKSFGERRPLGEKKGFGDRRPFGDKKSGGSRGFDRKAPFAWKQKNDTASNIEQSRLELTADLLEAMVREC